MSKNLKEIFEGETFSLTKSEIVTYTWDTYSLVQEADKVHTSTIDLEHFDFSKLVFVCSEDMDEFVGDKIRLGHWFDTIPSYEDLIEHVKRINAAETQYPIIVYNKTVINGTHRVLKAKLEGLKSIKAKVLKNMPEYLKVEIL